MTRAELAEAASISAPWLRQIEEYGGQPGLAARARIRAALAACPTHRRLGVPCRANLPVPPDEELYAPR